jgi:hypothetical protein
MNKIKEFIHSYLEYLRNLSYEHSEDRREFAIERLRAHREYMKNKKSLNPYLHPETWDD